MSMCAVFVDLYTPLFCASRGRNDGICDLDRTRKWYRDTENDGPHDEEGGKAFIITTSWRWRKFPVILVRAAKIGKRGIIRTIPPEPGGRGMYIDSVQAQIFVRNYHNCSRLPQWHSLTNQLAPLRHINTQIPIPPLLPLASSVVATTSTAVCSTAEQ